MAEQTRLFTRLVQTHKPDCILSLDGPEPEPASSPEELARTLGSDALGRYAAACRPIYEDLRRVIGQLSGLAILARVATHRDLADLPELKRCEERLRSTAERLERLSAPSGSEQHKQQLEAAFSFSRLAMGTFSAFRRTTAAEETLGKAEIAIKRAYAHLRAASTSRAKLEMVDFSNACCCGKHGAHAANQASGGENG